MYSITVIKLHYIFITTYELFDGFSLGNAHPETQVISSSVIQNKSAKKT